MSLINSMFSGEGVKFRVAAPAPGKKFDALSVPAASYKKMLHFMAL
jgi:hypothetical protein